MTDDDMRLGMGLDHDGIRHVAALTECSDETVIVHLITDHELTPDAITAAGPELTKLHMDLHMHVVQLREDDE